MAYQKPSTVLRALRRMAWLFGVYLRPRHVATADTANGVLSFDSRDRWLGRQLCVYREFEYEGMLEAIRQLRALGYLPEQNGGCLLDVGGYVGMISIGFLKAGFFDTALAVEPNPGSYQLLLRNVEQNGFHGRIEARNVALSDHRETMEMELSERNFGDHRIRSAEHGVQDFFGEGARATITIQAMPLDDLYAREPHLFNDVKLVWMDIQGHEGKFFAGARRFFADHARLPVVMEFWPYGLRRSGMTREAFCETVHSMFNAVYVMEAAPQRHDIGAIAELYDRFDGPESGAHLLFVREPG